MLDVLANRRPARLPLDVLCRYEPATIMDLVYSRGSKYRALAKGYALGSGNSIPEYVPVDGYLAMIDAAKKIRADKVKVTPIPNRD